MELEILRSEEHFTKESLEGGKRAKQYLDELLTLPNVSLLEHEIIINVNKKLLSSSKGRYSQHQRISSYKGHFKVYCEPEDIYIRMQTAIDRFNEKAFYRHLVFESLAEFVFDFLEIHPFSDGNGRTIKFLIFYVLKGFQRLKSFYCLEYSKWCEIIYTKSHKLMLEWFRSMQ